MQGFFRSGGTRSGGTRVGGTGVGDAIRQAGRLVGIARSQATGLFQKRAVWLGVHLGVRESSPAARQGQKDAAQS